MLYSTKTKNNTTNHDSRQIRNYQKTKKTVVSVANCVIVVSVEIEFVVSSTADIYSLRPLI